MANIEQLNFDLIINEKEFDEQIKRVEQLAGRLNTSVTDALNISKQLNLVSAEDVQSAKNLNKIKQDNVRLAEREKQLASTTNRKVAIDEVTKEAQSRRIITQEREKEAQAILKTQLAQEKLNRLQQQGSTQLAANSRLWREIKNLTTAYFSVMGATRLVSSLIQISAEFEKQKVSLRAILRDLDGADKIFNQIKALAVQSPFQFKELVTYTKQLSAFSIPMNELYDTTKMLADVSAGLGVGMDRLVLAYGQIRSASFLRGQEVRQLTEAGIPILEELRKQFEEMGEIGITAGEVFDKISSRQVTFEMVERVFKNMTEEGGKFYQMQEVLAATLSGKISNLKDAYQIMFAEIGEKTNGVLVKSVDTLRAIADNYEKIGKSILELVAAYGVYKGSLIAIEALNGAFVVSNHKVIDSILKVGKAVKGVVLSNPYALLAAGATAAAFSIYKLATAQSAHQKILKDFTKGIENSHQKIEAEVAVLDRLYVHLNAATEGTQEYESARKAIMSQYSTYIAQLKEEGKEVDDLTKLYDALKSAVQRAAYEKYRDTLTAQAKETFDKAEDDILKAFNSKFDAFTAPKAVRKATAAQKEALWMYITGTKSPSELIEKNLVTRPQLAFFEYMRKEYAQVANAYTFAVTEVEKSHDQMTNAFTDDAKDLTGWQKKVHDALEGFSSQATGNLEVDVYTNWSEYVDKVQKRYQELNVELAKNTGINETAAKANREEMEAIRQVNQALDGRLLREYNVTKATKTQSGDKVKDIQSEIDVYQKLKEVYSSLIETMGEEEAKRVMEQFFPQYKNLIDDDYDNEINRLAKELEALAATNEDAAKAWLAFQDALSTTKVDSLTKSAQAAKKYREEIQKWIDEGYLLSGTGFSYDISKNLLDITTKDATTSRTFEALRSAIDEQEEAYKASIEGTEEEREKMWQQFKIEQIHILDELARHEMANNHKAVQEKIRDLAQTYVREMYATNADGKIELNDWGDKSMAQIEMIGRSLRTLMNSDLEIPDKIKKDAEDLGVTFDELMEAIREIFTADYSNVLQERMKRMSSILGNVLSLANKITNSVGSMADHIEDGPLKDFTEMLGVVLDVADAVVECEPLLRAFAEAGDGAADAWKNLLNSADLMTMVVKILGIGVEQIVRNVEKQYDKQKEIAEAAKEYKKTLDEIALSRYDGILGVDDMGKMAKYYEQMTNSAREYQRTIALLQNYSMFDPLFEQIPKLSDDLRSLDVTELKAILAELKLFGASGGDQWLKGDIVTGLEDYIEKLEQYRDALSDLFSNVADDIVDNMIDAFDKIGDAVGNIEDAFYDLGDVILRSVLRSMVLENIVEKYKNDFMKAVTEYALTDKTENDATALAAQLGNITSSLREELEDSGGIFNAIIEAFRDAGLVDYNMDNEVSNTVGGGIKSITEDTANLLASYINAIRADVAAIRQAVVSGNTNTLPSPTLAEYLTQIQANTYNNAIAAQNILERLDSVMTMSDGPAFRVFM